MKNLLKKKWFRILAGLLGVCMLLFTLGAMTIDKWLFVMLNPGKFDSALSPPKPDYSSPKAWAALPTREDGADVYLRNHPAIQQTTASADVFFVHPTTWVGEKWNGAIDDPIAVEGTHRGAMLIQASAFNACCAVYAPRYRQSNGRAFVMPDKEGKKAADLAYSDVLAAFRYFRKHYNKGRPFVLASHSQGTVMAARLLKEEIWGKAASKDLVASYLIGGPVTSENLGKDIPICSSATQTGCVVAYNARGPRFKRNGLEFASPTSHKDPMVGRICVNPLTWKNDSELAPNSLHKGAIFFDAKEPKVIPSFANARCYKGRLLITKMEKPYRDTPSKVLDWIMGPDNYHPFEYQLYYLNIRENAIRRVDAFLSLRQKTIPTTRPSTLPSSTQKAPAAQ